jgi:hypothetical protein
VTEPTQVQRCQVCQHPSVLGINTAITNGKSYRAISRDYHIGSEASGTFKPDHQKVKRHAERCLATSFQEIQKTSMEVQGAAIHVRLKELEAHVDKVIQDAQEGDIVMVGDTPLLDEEGHPRTHRTTSHLRVILGAVRESRQTQALIAKLAGAMPDEDTEGAEAAREGLKDPKVRALVQEMEKRLAELQTEAGHDQVTN